MRQVMGKSIKGRECLYERSEASQKGSTGPPEKYWSRASWRRLALSFACTISIGTESYNGSGAKSGSGCQAAKERYGVESDRGRIWREEPCRRTVELASWRPALRAPLPLSLSLPPCAPWPAELGLLHVPAVRTSGWSAAMATSAKLKDLAADTWLSESTLRR
jgi:hypothetical protein